MMPDKTAAFILGSSRKKKNTYVFARSLMKAFEKRDYNPKILNSIDNDKELSDSFIQTVETADIICILTPLYADFLPSHLIRVLELLQNSSTRRSLKGKRLFGFSQCAFPFYRLNECSIKSMEIFARKTGMQWMGGLMCGGAGMMDCEALEEMGKKGKKMIKALDMSAEQIVKGEKVPEEAQKLLIVNLPRFLKRPVTWFINRNVRKIEKEIGKDLEREAYLE